MTDKSCMTCMWGPIPGNDDCRASEPCDGPDCLNNWRPKEPRFPVEDAKPTANQSMDYAPMDTQIGGDHYKTMAIQPMELSMKNGLDACQHTAIKYIMRFRDKNGIEDLDKAIHCIEMLKAFYKEELENYGAQD